jgi:hypothetical protein
MCRHMGPTHDTHAACGLQGVGRGQLHLGLRRRPLQTILLLLLLLLLLRLTLTLRGLPLGSEPSLSSLLLRLVLLHAEPAREGVRGPGIGQHPAQVRQDVHQPQGGCVVRSGRHPTQVRQRPKGGLHALEGAVKGRVLPITSTRANASPSTSPSASASTCPCPSPGGASCTTDTPTTCHHTRSG